MRKRQTGFTLIELMIAVAIVGILAAIAVPSYQESVMKSRRTDAKGALMSLANAMERHFTENNTYCNAGGTGGANTCGDADATFDTGIPPGNIYAPTGATATFYQFEIFAANESTYTIRAIPVDGSAQANDKCGILSLNSVGQRDAKKDDNPVPNCWD